MIKHNFTIIIDKKEKLINEKTISFLTNASIIYPVDWKGEKEK